ncbi:hypothetical protein [Meiothermus sp.]
MNDLAVVNPRDMALTELEDITAAWDWSEFFDGVGIGIAIGTALVCGGI